MQAALDNPHPQFTFSISGNLVHQIQNTYMNLDDWRMVEIFNLSGDMAYVNGVPKEANFALGLTQRKSVAAYGMSIPTSSDFFHGPVAEVFREDLSHISFLRKELNHFCTQSLSWEEETEYV